MGLNEESAKLKGLLQKVVKEIINQETKSCLRLYKAVVKTAPNGSTCGVRLVGETQIIDLPYSSKVSNVVIDDFVWVATLYNSFSNAIVWETVDFK